MTYTITALATLAESMLRPLLASLSVGVISEATDHGFTTLAIECDEATAAAIEAAGFEVAERYESPSTSVHAIVRQLSFTGNSHQIQKAEALGCYFRVGPTADGKQWKWGVFSRETRCFLYRLVDTREEAIACCNREWQRMLEPYLEVR
jgi:hypothetical protein